jgi:hypothetical protein
MPVMSSWGVFFSVLCFQELCTYSAIGKSCAHPLGYEAHHGCKYCSSQVFILSVCPSVLGWKAVERFCWMPSTLQRVTVN